MASGDSWTVDITSDWEQCLKHVGDVMSLSRKLLYRFWLQKENLFRKWIFQNDKTTDVRFKYKEKIQISVSLLTFRKTIWLKFFKMLSL